MSQEVTLPPSVRRFVVRATRGGTRESDDKGDIAVDDFMVVEGPCYSGNNILLFVNHAVYPHFFAKIFHPLP